SAGAAADGDRRAFRHPAPAPREAGRSLPHRDHGAETRRSARDERRGAVRGRVEQRGASPRQLGLSRTRGKRELDLGARGVGAGTQPTTNMNQHPAKCRTVAPGPDSAPRSVSGITRRGAASARKYHDWERPENTGNSRSDTPSGNSHRYISVIFCEPCNESVTVNGSINSAQGYFCD